MKPHPLRTLSHWTVPATNREQGIARHNFRIRQERQRQMQRFMQEQADAFAFELERLQMESMGEPAAEEQRVVVQ
jgi:hypothetical protein